MQQKLEMTPREREEQRLSRETNGIFAPSKPGIFAQNRVKVVEKYIKEGLKKFDKSQEEEQRLRKETNGIFAPAKPGSAAAKRRLERVEKYVQKGLENFDGQNDDESRVDLIKPSYSK